MRPRRRVWCGRPRACRPLDCHKHGNLVEDTLQSPGALTGRRVPLYERSGEGERAPASGLVALAQSGGEDAGPARPDGDES